MAWRTHLRTMLKSRIHRATVTGADVNYEGSITLDPHLMDAAGILSYEQVHVLDINNGNRLTTYAIEGDRGSGDVVTKGAAARLVTEGGHRHRPDVYRCPGRERPRPPADARLRRPGQSHRQNRRGYRSVSRQVAAPTAGGTEWTTESQYQISRPKRSLAS